MIRTLHIKKIRAQLQALFRTLCKLSYLTAQSLVSKLGAQCDCDAKSQTAGAKRRQQHHQPSKRASDVTRGQAQAGIKILAPAANALSIHLINLTIFVRHHLRVLPNANSKGVTSPSNIGLPIAIIPEGKEQHVHPVGLILEPLERVGQRLRLTLNAEPSGQPGLEKIVNATPQKRKI
eukprot:1152455-Pelagomonas_calceolata.AAC.6